MFDDQLIKEFTEWSRVNEEHFSWWSYVNMKADIQTALGFAKFFSPAIVELEGCLFLKDQFSQRRFEGWKRSCNGDSTCMEKMMNLYQLRDFFHLNVQNEDDQQDELLITLGRVLEHFWSLKFKHQYPDREVIVEVFEEDDGELLITVFQKRD
ncbi:hypothetical protein EDD58_101409 [Hazenella coriacea]|uniref:Uncharacterized protein n=1 Tax=Hazenella coriacea TaxID=1179467 RepID=A0A4R3LBT9_9BACL|nr:hypothetical protein EDD58_101409 [Hazenella coriacea]